MTRESIGKTGISDDALAAYFDGEASDAEAKGVREAIEGDPELAAELEQLGIMQELTQASLKSAAAEVPEARFEQIWDQIDRAIEQGERLQDSANAPAGLWGRLMAAFAPVKWPLAAAGAAAAVTLLAVNIGSEGAPGETVDDTIADRGTDHRANKAPELPSEVSADDGVAQPAPTQDPAANPMPDPTRLALRHPVDVVRVGQPLAPLPENSRVKFHEIEGAGNDVRISSGTVTVLYVEDDAEEQGSERSL
ncbi:MAG: hypothetical protein JKY37_21125 [Nannocystaceae bacterium]|nr:hypothetical protein [Nannocystaceae bacterium]